MKNNGSKFFILNVLESVLFTLTVGFVLFCKIEGWHTLFHNSVYIVLCSIFCILHITTSESYDNLLSRLRHLELEIEKKENHHD